MGKIATVYEIGPFRLEPQKGVLMRLGMAEPLGRRAIDVLTALVANARRPMTREAIIGEAWPGVIVEEANLTVQVSSLRRVLAQAPGGERWIETLSGRGYRFVGPVIEVSDGVAHEAEDARPGHLPEPLASFVGRERELAELKRLLGKHRILTLAGAGGIGKTRLALQLAAEVRDAYRDGVWFIDLAAVADPDLVPSAIARTLGIHETPGKPLTDGLCRHLKGRRALLIVDNCEHVVDASARVAEAILRGAAEPTIVATSREPLRVEGEQTYRVAPLSLPDPLADLESIRRSDAITLFVERAQLHRSDFALSEGNAPTIARLCARLDGIPLALELAAPLLGAFSIDEVYRRLEDRLGALSEGRRTAPPRQQTLRATLDWSHGLLSDEERAVLRRVSVFRGGFSAAGAAAVCADAVIAQSTVAHIISRLVARSLVTGAHGPRGTRYALLEITREYGSEKLAAAGETRFANERQARFLCDCFEHATDEYWRAPDADWRSAYAADADNVRAALDWAIGAEGDAAIGIRLCGAAAGLWLELSLRNEGLRRVQAALARTAATTPETDQARLRFWLGYLGVYALGEAAVLEAFERAAALYRRAGDTAGLGRSLAQLGTESAYGGHAEQARARLSEALPLLERSDQSKAVAECLIGLGYLEMSAGRLDAALACCERSASLCREAGAERIAIGALQTLAYIHWSSGHLDAAIEEFREAAEIARKLKRRGALGQILTNLTGALTERGELRDALAAAREGLPLRHEVGEAWFAMDHLALRAALAGKTAESARLAGFADRAHAAKDYARQPNEARARERLDAVLGAKLSAEDLELLLAEGAKMSEDEACRLALED